MATFPAGLTPTVRSTFRTDPVNTTNTSKVGFVTQFTGNGSSEFQTMVLHLEVLDSTDYATFITFFNTNIGEDIDLTVSGVSYTGTFSGPVQTAFRGDKYSVAFRMYVAESA